MEYLGSRHSAMHRATTHMPGPWGEEIQRYRATRVWYVGCGTCDMEICRYADMRVCGCAVMGV